MSTHQGGGCSASPSSSSYPFTGSYVASLTSLFHTSLTSAKNTPITKTPTRQPATGGPYCSQTLGCHGVSIRSIWNTPPTPPLVVHRPQEMMRAVELSDDLDFG